MKTRRVIIATFVLPLLVARAFATTDTWDGGGADNNLSTNLNWADNTAPLSDLVNTDIVFAGTVRLTPNVSVAFSTNSITFNNTAGANAFTIGGNPLNVGAGGITNNDADTNSFTNGVIFNGVANATINAASGGLAFSNQVTLPTSTLTVDGAAATSFFNFFGTSALTKQGAGTMTWTPNATSNLDLTISAGTVTTGADGSTDVLSSSASIAVNGTSILAINESMTLDGAQLTRVSGATVTIATGKTLLIQNSGSANITSSFSNPNASTIVVTGAGSTFSTTSTLSVNNGNALTVSSGGAASNSAGSLNVGTIGDGTVTVTGNGSSFAGGGGLSLGSAGNTGSLTFSSNSSGSFAGFLNVANSGAGTMGTLTVQSGASLSGAGLSVAQNAVANTGAVTITGSGSVLTVTGAATTTLGAASTGTGNLNVALGGTFTSGTGIISVNTTGTVAITASGTFNANGNMTLSGQLTRDATGVFNLAAGKTLTVQNTGDAIITGSFANNTASTIAVTGAGSTFTTTSTLSINGGSAMNVTLAGAVSSGAGAVNIGSAGNGTATVADSGSSFNGGSLTIGQLGNTGSLTFSGGASGAFGAITVSNIAPGTNGSLSIQSGATVSGSSLFLASSSAATPGMVTITGAGSALTITGASTTSISGNLDVLNSGTFNSGTGIISVSTPGEISITGGTFNANGNLNLNSGQLSRGNPGTFTLATGKTFNVGAGLATFTGSLNLTNANCALNVNNGGSFTVSSTFNTSNSFDLNVTAGSVSVGSINMGSGSSADVLNVTGSGSTFSCSSGSSSFGNATVTFDSNSTGSFSTLSVDPDNFGLVGRTSTFVVQGGADVTATFSTNIGNGGDLGTSNSSILTVTGAGSTFTQTGASFLGIGAGSGAGVGTGTLNVANGGIYTSSAGTNLLDDTGTINIDGGTLILAGPLVRSGGALNFNTGALSIVDNFVVGLGGLLGTDVTFDSTRQFTTSATTTIDAFHTLTVNGGTFNTGSLVVNGTFAFNSGTVGITGAGGLTIGGGGPLGTAFTLGAGRTLNVTNATTINPGSLMVVESGAVYSTGTLANSGEFDLDGLAATANATSVSNSGLIRGEGRIVASAVSNAFTNNASGELRAESGNRIQIVGSNGANAGKINLQSGTAEFTQPLTNGSTGQIVGRGTLITGGTGLTNNGNISLSGGLTDVFGDVNNATGSGTKGITISGNAGVTFWDDVTNGAGSLFKVSGGSSATFFGTFGGAGITGTGSTYFESDITPGFSPASITFGGDVHLSSTATLKMEVGGTSPGTQFDQVHVTGQLALAGTLNVSLINSFTPVIGNSFDILDWTALSGTFSAIQLPTLSGAAWDASQLYTTGTLNILPMKGDVNRDTHVNVADVSALMTALSDLSTYQGSLTNAQLAEIADLTGDNLVTNTDVQGLIVLLANGGGSGAPGAGALNAVPEPSAMALSLLAALACIIHFGCARYSSSQPTTSTSPSLS